MCKVNSEKMVSFERKMQISIADLKHSYMFCKPASLLIAHLLVTTRSPWLLGTSAVTNGLQTNLAPQQNTASQSAGGLVLPLWEPSRHGARLQCFL